MGTSDDRVESNPVEEKVLGLLSAQRLRTSDLMSAASQHGLSSADVREAVWSLLDDGRLALAADRKLIVP